MGRAYAESVAASVVEGVVDLETALVIHLTANHYPPVSTLFVPSAKRAIELVERDDSGQEVELPNGLVLTAGLIVEGLHLESFLGLGKGNA